MLVEIAMTMSVFLASECFQLIRNLPLAKAGQELKFLSLSSADTTLVWAKSQVIIDGCVYNLCIQNRSKLYIFHRFIYLGHHVSPLQHLATYQNQNVADSTTCICPEKLPYTLNTRWIGHPDSEIHQ